MRAHSYPSLSEKNHAYFCGMIFMTSIQKYSVWLTSAPADLCFCCLGGWLTGSLVEWVGKWLDEWSVGWLGGWLIVWVVVWLVGWVCGWVVGWLVW